MSSSFIHVFKKGREKGRFLYFSFKVTEILFKMLCITFHPLQQLISSNLVELSAFVDTGRAVLEPGAIRILA